MPVACENSRIDCPLTKEVLEEFKKRLERWTCPCTKQREADIIAPISDVYLETLTRLRIPSVVIDGGGRTKSTELMMKGRNPNNIALSINNLGHMQFLNRLENVTTLDDLQVINDAFVALGQALGMPEPANTIFDEFCALTLQSPPLSGQDYKNAVLQFACKHVGKYGDEKIFSSKKLVVPSFYDHYARNNTQACINKFDDVTSAADIRLWHLHQLMSSRGGKKCSDDAKVAVTSYYALLADELSPKQALDHMKEKNPKDYNHVLRLLKFDAMAKFSALPSDEVDLEKVKAAAELLCMKLDDLQSNIDACRKGRSKSVKNKEAAIISYYVCLAEGLTPERALARIKKEREEDHSHLLSYLKFEAMTKLSALPADMVDLKKVETTADLLGMKMNDLLQNIDACRKGRSNPSVDSDSVRHLKCIENAEKDPNVTEGQFVVSEKTTLESRTSGSTHTKGITLCTVCNTEISCYVGNAFNKSKLTNHASTENCKRARQLRQNNQSEGDILHLKCIENAEKHPSVMEGQFVVSEKTTLEASRGSTLTKGITLCTICNTEFTCYCHGYQKNKLIAHASGKKCKEAR